MRTFFAAPRVCSDYAAVCDAVRNAGFQITEIVTNGENELAVRWAAENNVPIKPVEQPLDSSTQALVAIWNGECVETANLIKTARAHGKVVYVHLV